MLTYPHHKRVRGPRADYLLIPRLRWGGGKWELVRGIHRYPVTCTREMHTMLFTHFKKHCSRGRSTACAPVHGPIEMWRTGLLLLICWNRIVLVAFFEEQPPVARSGLDKRLMPQSSL
jgi:hypothetical protein